MTRARDALNVKRRQLPMVRIDKEYRFEGPDGTATLLELFEGRRQLMVSHFMFDPEWDDGCPSCTAGAEEVSDGLLEHLHSRDTTLVYVSRAPIKKITAYKSKKGWTFPWYSSFGGDFNYDFHVTLDAAVAPVEYNYRDQATLEATDPAWAGWSGEQPGLSCFLRSKTRCSTPTHSSPAGPSRPAVRTTSSTSPPWVARKSGRSPKDGLTRPGRPPLTSPADARGSRGTDDLRTVPASVPAKERTRRKEKPVPRITPNLWFDTQGQEAAEFYVSVFPTRGSPM